jgi:hypothetical protein
MAARDASITNRKEVGKLTLEISPEAIKAIIGSGRLLELADTMAKEAAAQISAQIVDRVAEAAVSGGIQSGVGAGVAFIFDGGDFGTIPPRPKWGVLNLEQLGDTALRRMAAAGTVAS